MEGCVLVKKHGASQEEEVFAAEVRQIIEFAHGIKFGSVTIQIVDGKITQVDKLEKIRFDKKRNE